MNSRILEMKSRSCPVGKARKLEKILGQGVANLGHFSHIFFGPCTGRVHFLPRPQHGNLNLSCRLLVIFVGMMAVILTACEAEDRVETAVSGEPTLNATQQAIAIVLTFQAENPRPTRTMDRWAGFVRTATAEALLTTTATPTLNPTQEAVAAILTYQAENPRPTGTRWSGVNLSLTAQAESRFTPTVTPTLTSSPTPTSVPTPRPRTADITIPGGSTPFLDGRLAAEEWDDAANQRLEIDGIGTTQVRYKHDDAHLYFVFNGLNQGEIALFPELFIDAGFDSNLTWDENDHWFHVSTNLCHGTGPDAIWQQCGLADGWTATDFSQSDTVIEMRIPYELIGLQAGQDQAIGIGWNVMMITPSDEEVRIFWPETAVLDQPVTWAKGTAVGGW